MLKRRNLLLAGVGGAALLAAWRYSLPAATAADQNFRVTHTDAMYHQVDDMLMSRGLAEAGDKVVVISGSPPGISGTTNDLRVHIVGTATAPVAPVHHD